MEPFHHGGVLGDTTDPWAGSTVTVGTAGQAEHFGGATGGLQDGVKLLGLFGGTTTIFFANNEERGGLAFERIRNGRAAAVRLGHLIGRSTELAHCKCGTDIGGAIKAVPIGDRVLCDCRFEALIVGDEPTRMVPAG